MAVRRTKAEKQSAKHNQVVYKDGQVSLSQVSSTVQKNSQHSAVAERSILEALLLSSPAQVKQDLLKTGLVTLCISILLSGVWYWLK